MLHVHRAARADSLLDVLGDLLAEVPPDPFRPELVAVPTRGVERWVTQTLSMRLGTSGAARTDGVLAGVAFPAPRAITDAAVAAACGLDATRDPWSRDRLLWPLLEVVDRDLHEPWLATLAEHLRDSAGLPSTEGEQPPRLVAVRHLALLLDRYAQHRPAMLRAWAAGQDVDGTGAALAPQVRWQAELWRRLAAHVGTPDPASRLTAATAALRAGGVELDLPERLALFGLTRVAAAQLEVLEALAHVREVHLLLLHPSPALWDRVAAALERAPGPVRRRADDPTAALPANRLLASWGRDARELQLVLAGLTDAPRADAPAPASDTRPPATTLLQLLQDDVRADRAAPGPPRPDEDDARPLLAAADRSVEIHACHGRSRQVEVLRDAILHALREDPSLEPRDVIVMCPDIETFAPLIHATFGAAVLPDRRDADELPVPPDLRVRLADRALHQSNPVLGTLARVLELADQRLTASQVLDLADREPVRRRFGFDDDELVRLEEWVRASGARWGLDGAHRAPFGLGNLEAGTWRSAVDRLLLGVTMTEDDHRLVAGVLPLDDVGSGDIDLAGRFAELLDRLDAIVGRWSVARPVGAWAQELADAADLLASTTSRDAWQREELDRVLADVAAAAGGHGASTALTLTEVRELLRAHLAGRPTRANFRTGHLTFCTLMPMRSIPHRVVCLLGLDDEVFPRKAPRDGDDLVVADPHVGDHDGRTEDRQLLLDALLAAGDRLLITFSGNDERTNAPRPPAVPVGELLDVVDRTVRTDDGRPAREAVTIRHPLQPFDPRAFVPGRLRGDGPFGFDHAALEGARALTGERAAVPPFLSGALPPLQEDVLAVDDLVRFVQHPARAFLRRRLAVSLVQRDDELADDLPVELGPLELWALGDRLLRGRLAGHPLEVVHAAEQARGGLPPGQLAADALTKVREQVEAIAAAVGEAETPVTVDARVRLADGRLVHGTIPGVRGALLREVVYSRVAPKHRLAAWVRLLALTAARPDEPWETCTIGRRRAGGARGATVTIARIPPLGGTPDERRAAALEALTALVDLHDRGMREVPPLMCATSAAYAHATWFGGNPVAAATKAWESEWEFPKEDKDPEHVELLRGVRPFGDLVVRGPRPDESGPGWDARQPHRFGRWAMRLWSGLLAVEEVHDR